MNELGANPLLQQFVPRYSAIVADQIVPRYKAFVSELKQHANQAISSGGNLSKENAAKLKERLADITERYAAWKRHFPTLTGGAYD